MGGWSQTSTRPARVVEDGKPVGLGKANQLAHAIRRAGLGNDAIG